MRMMATGRSLHQKWKKKNHGRHGLCAGKPCPCGPDWLAGKWRTARGYLQEKYRKNKIREIFNEKATINADDNSIPSSRLLFLHFRCWKCCLNPTGLFLFPALCVSRVQSLLEPVISVFHQAQWGLGSDDPFLWENLFQSHKLSEKNKESSQKAHYPLSSCYMAEWANT